MTFIFMHISENVSCDYKLCKLGAMDAVKIRIERDRYRRVRKEAKAAPHANRVELFWVTELL